VLFKLSNLKRVPGGVNGAILIPIPSSVDPEILTEAAKAPLEIGAGGSSSGKQAVPPIQGAEEGEDERARESHSLNDTPNPGRVSWARNPWARSRLPRRRLQRSRLQRSRWTRSPRAP